MTLASKSIHLVSLFSYPVWPLGKMDGSKTGQVLWKGQGAI